MTPTDDPKPHLQPKEFARKLRLSLTHPERLLWSQLRNRRLRGFKFLRQFVVDEYIVDFVCREHSVVIELDGDSHNERGHYDSKRQRHIESMGYRVLRYSNDEVLRELPLVLESILRHLPDGPQTVT